MNQTITNRIYQKAEADGIERSDVERVLAVISAEFEITHKMLKQEEAANILNVSPKTLEKWRATGSPLKFAKYGNRAIRLRACDVTDFINNQLYSSTSEFTENPN